MASAAKTLGGGGNWIAGATAGAHGQFSAKAKRAGMKTLAYAEKQKAAPGRLGKQARLAITLIHGARRRGAGK